MTVNYSIVFIGNKAYQTESGAAGLAAQAGLTVSVAEAVLRGARTGIDGKSVLVKNTSGTRGVNETYGL